MKKIIRIILFAIIIGALTACEEKYDFEIDEIQLESSPNNILIDDIDYDNIISEQIILGIWNNSYIIDGEEQVNIRYYIFDNNIYDYLYFLFGAMWSEQDKIIDHFNNVNNIGFISINLDEGRIYIGPKELTEKTKKDVYIVEFNVDESVQNSTDIDDLNELTLLVNQYNSIDFSPILVVILQNRDSYAYTAFLSTIDTINELALIEGFYVYFGVSNGMFQQPTPFEIIEGLYIENIDLPNEVILNDTVDIYYKNK
jgi:hypothetical protein